MISWAADKPPNWDREGSLALVVLPVQPAGKLTVRDIPIPDAEVVANTLTKRLSDVAEKEICWLDEQMIGARSIECPGSPDRSI